MSVTGKTKKSVSVDLLHGSILKALILFALPIFASNVFQQIYNTMDTVIVGHTLGDSSVAAMGSCSSIYDVLVGFAIGVGNGLAIVTARSYGLQKIDRLKQSVAASLVIGALLSVTITAAAMLFLRPLLRILNTPENILEEAYSYISFVILFLFVMFAYNLCAGLLRAIGNSLVPLLFLVASSLLNIGLDLLFILYFDLGVKGAAIATVIAQAVSVVFCLIYIFSKAKLLIPEKKHFLFDAKLYRELLAQGFSMGFMSSIVSAGSMILQSGINELGYLTIAGHTAARRLFSFSIMPYTSIAQAINTYTAQNRGADQPARIRKGIFYAYAFDFCMTILLILIITPAAPYLIRLVSGSKETIVLENGSRYLRTVVWFYFILGLVNCSRMALQGLGEKVKPLFSSITELVGKILFAMIFIPRYQYTAVIFCEPVIWCFMAAELVFALFTNPYMKQSRERN